MSFNRSDEKVEHCLARAKEIKESNPPVESLISDLPLFVDYRTHFENWYGSSALETQLVSALVGLCHMIKMTTTEKKINVLSEWIKDQPIRNTLCNRIGRLVDTAEMNTVPQLIHKICG